MPELTIAQPRELPVGPIGRSGIGWWGVMVLVASEAALFSYLLFCYYYVGAIANSGWLLEPHPSLTLALPDTALLIASSFVAWYGERGVEAGNRVQALTGLGGAFVMGVVFVAVQMVEWSQKSFGFGASSYASLYYTTTAFHMMHVVVGLVILAALFAWVAADFFSPRRRITVSAGVLYWHFVDVVWLFVFSTFYLTPYLGFAQ